jgi:beta-glucanase (GH16 family)
MRIAVLCVVLCIGAALACTPSITQVSGPLAPSLVCSGQLIFEDDFDCVDTSKWTFENSLAGGGNWEFQWYPGYDRNNFYIRNGSAHFVPTLTSELFGEAFLTSGRASIPPQECTQADWWGCDRTGNADNIINPIRSTRIDTRNSFGFVYGEMEIRAKMPAGDWLWPALWLMPFHNAYGGWPRSGEIDLLETRGNRNLFSGSTNVGVEQGGSTMHFGPNWNFNGFETSTFSRNQRPGLDANFHNYRLRWTADQIQFFYDNTLVGTVSAGNGFWERGGFANSGWVNPWANATLMAPFDRPFFIIMNLAVGGVNFFSDDFENRPHRKPWHNNSPHAPRDFWRERSNWESTWNRDTDDSHMQVDYVRVWAL